MLSKIFKEILTKEQIALLPLLKLFSFNFGLVGGTAIALQIGHRRSIDFDLFTSDDFENDKIKRKISQDFKINAVLKDEKDQYTLVIQGVRFTFFRYLYPIRFSKKFDSVIKIPNLLTLAAMKALALGRRAKWKDYIDLYFIMKNYFSLIDIIKTARQIFVDDFNEKLFRSQLAYFKDIDYTEEIIYIEGQKIADKIIKKELINLSLS